MHSTKDKANFAVSKVITDLLSKGYEPVIPFSDHLTYDLVAEKSGLFIRLQVKYIGDTKRCIASKVCTSGHKKTYRDYNKDDFDFYALYFANIDKVIYPSINYAGLKIRTVLPNCGAKFYWYEDFITDEIKHIDVQKRGLGDFGKKSTYISKVTRIPPKPELEKYLSELPVTKIAKIYNVSDRCVSKWIDKHELDRKPRGFWLKHE